jgi:hypothetical protein
MVCGPTMVNYDENLAIAREPWLYSRVGRLKSGCRLGVKGADVGEDTGRRGAMPCGS